MRLASERSSRWSANLLIGPVVLLALAVILLAALGLRSAALQSDTISVARQTREVELALSTSQDELAQSQAGIAIWDLAQIELRRPRPNLTWLDNNIGIYLNFVFSHQADFILNGRDHPVYGAVLGERIAAARYARFAEPLRPMVDAVRGRIRVLPNPHERLPGARTHPQSTARTSPRAIHATDLVLLDGRPAVVSVMRMIPDTKAVKLTPGAEPLLISIRFLDSGFSRDLYQLKLIENARISQRLDLASGERAIPLLSSRGGRIGYFIWHPELPGSVLLTSMGPIAAVEVALIIIALVFLALRLAKAMRANADSLARLQAAHSDLKAKEEQAQFRALHDELTRLPNRQLFNDAVERALALGGGDRPPAIMLLDLDRFKQVNDTLGHPAGDVLLTQVAARVRAALGQQGLAARLGGDEFAVLVPSGRTEAEIQAIAEALIDDLERPFLLSGTEVFIGASIGIVIDDQRGGRSELIRRADLAMYRAKQDGRGRLQFFSGAMEEAAMLRTVLERDLRTALAEQDQLFVEYQPRVAAAEHRVIGFEALLRWRHPTRGIIPPQQFIPLAEEIGLIEEIGLWVLEQTASVAREWPLLSFAVNVSPVQLRDCNFPERARACVERFGVQPSQLEFEVTEGILLDDDRVSSAVLDALRKNGFDLSLDDFGTGYSSLSYLSRFKVNKIKIDRSFIARLERGPDAAAIVCAVVALGRAMGLKVAAEGIETIEQRDFLGAAGCDELQGYFFSPALHREALPNFLAEPSVTKAGLLSAVRG